jgi:hypothetical protein
MPTTHLNSRWGKSATNPDQDQMRAVLAELNQTDDEHPDCWLSDENGWTVSVSQNGWVVLENVETESDPRHLRLRSPDEALEIWKLLTVGDLVTLRAKPWQPGYPQIA